MSLTKEEWLALTLRAISHVQNEFSPVAIRHARNVITDAAEDFHKFSGGGNDCAERERGADAPALS